MSTTYPANIDNGTTLPLAVDNTTGIHAVSVNQLNGAIIAIESELGQLPAGLYTTVRARLDALESLIRAAVVGDFSPSGDLSGSQIHQTVIGLQTNPLAPGVLGPSQDGYVLTWIYATRQWTAQPEVTGFMAGGDLAGTSTNQTVIALQGNPVQSGTLSSTQDGYILTWINAATKWEAKPAPVGFMAGGDLTGTATDQTVVSAQNGDILFTGTTTPTILSTSTATSLTLGTNNSGATLNLQTDAAVTILSLVRNISSQNTTYFLSPANTNPGKWLSADNGVTEIGNTYSQIQFQDNSVGIIYQAYSMGLHTFNDNGAIQYAEITNGGIIIEQGAGSTSYLQWVASAQPPEIYQVQSTTGNGQNFFIRAQDGYATHPANGGNLFLSSGAKNSTGTDGYVALETGGNIQLEVSPTVVTVTSLAGNGDGYVGVHNSGNLFFTSTIGSGGIAPGTSGQIFVTDSAPASTWTSLISYETTHGRFTAGGGGSDFKATIGPVPSSETIEAGVWLILGSVGITSGNYTLLCDGTNTAINAPSGGIDFEIGGTVYAKIVSTDFYFGGFSTAAPIFIDWSTTTTPFIQSGTSATSLTIGTGNTTTTTTLELGISAMTADVQPGALTIQGAYAYASATGAHRTPGSIIFDIGAPTNSGTTEATYQFTRNGVLNAQIGVQSGDYPNTYLWLGETSPTINNFIIGTDSVNTYISMNGPAGFIEFLQANYGPVSRMTGTDWYIGGTTAAAPVIIDFTTTTTPFIQSGSSATSLTVGTNNAGATLNLQAGTSTAISIVNVVSTNTTTTFNSPGLATAAQINVNDNGAVSFNGGAANYILFNTSSGNTYVTYNTENHYFEDNTSHPYLTLGLTDTYFGGTTTAAPLYIDWSTATTPAIIAGTSSTSLRVGTNNTGAVLEFLAGAFIPNLQLSTNGTTTNTATWYDYTGTSAFTQVVNVGAGSIISSANGSTYYMEWDCTPGGMRLASTYWYVAGAAYWMSVLQSNAYFGAFSSSAAPIYFDWNTTTTPFMSSGTAATQLTVGTNNTGAVLYLAADDGYNNISLDKVGAVTNEINILSPNGVKQSNIRTNNSGFITWDASVNSAYLEILNAAAAIDLTSELVFYCNTTLVENYNGNVTYWTYNSTGSFLENGYLGLQGAAAGTYPTLGQIRNTDHAGTGSDIIGMEYFGTTYVAVSQQGNLLTIGARYDGTHSVATTYIYGTTAVDLVLNGSSTFYIVGTSAYLGTYAVANTPLIYSWATTTTPTFLSGGLATSLTVGTNKSGASLILQGDAGITALTLSGAQGGIATFAGAIDGYARKSSANFTVDTGNNDYYIWLTASQTVTLPAPTLGRTLEIWLDGYTAAADLTLTLHQHASENINGIATSWAVTASQNQILKLDVRSFDGTNWWVAS